MSNEKVVVGAHSVMDLVARLGKAKLPAGCFLNADPDEMHAVRTIVIQPTWWVGDVDEHGFRVEPRKRIDEAYLAAFDAVTGSRYEF